MLYAIIGLLTVILDQAVKYWVSMNIFPESTGRVLIPGILSLANLQNDGAAFGFLAGSNARIPFIIITGVFLVLVILALATKFISGRFARWCLVLVAAGGFSNCIDRVIYGYVQDMFKIELFNFPIFNVADIFITVFAILFILAVLFERQTVYDDDELDEEEEEEYEEDEEEEEEEPEPVKPQRKSRKERAAEEYARKQAAEEEARERKKAAAEEARERKQAAEEEARERKKAAAAERSAAASPKAKAAPAKAAPAKSAQEEDIFAAWEQANARANARAAEERFAKAAPQGAPAKAAPAKAAAPVKSAPAPAKAAAPAKAPAPAKAAKPAAAKKPVVEEEFSLDDILAEFK